jgi:PAS domain S-box-containing protein
MQLDRLLEESNEPETEAQLQWWVKAAVTVAVLLTVLLSFLSWRAAQQATENTVWVAHTQEVLRVLESTLRHSLDVETGGRGFAETGSVPFLDPYQSGRPAVVQDLHALRLLLVTRDQLDRLNLLEQHANNQVEDVEGIVATRQNTGKIPAVSLFAQGKHDMDAVRITVEQMEATERGLLASRTQSAHEAKHSSTVVIALGSLLGVIFLSFAGMRVSREIGVSARGRAQIKALNADLERRVEQRTAALEAEAAARLESESRLAAVIKSAMDSIITVDDGQRIVLFNQAAEKMFDCSRSEAMGRPIEGFIPHLRRLGENGFTNQGMGLQDEMWAVRADGEKLQIEASISENELAGHHMFTVILRDISERKETEVRLATQAAEVVHSRQALETQKLMLQSVLDSMVEGLVAADEQGNFILWNPAAGSLDRVQGRSAERQGWSVAWWGGRPP